jgi:hypothetical protein
MCKRLSGDITRLKAQKVAVQRNLEASAKQHAQWRLDREKVSQNCAPLPATPGNADGIAGSLMPLCKQQTGEASTPPA